jgi:hypothetical protein
MLRDRFNFGMLANSTLKKDFMDMDLNQQEEEARKVGFRISIAKCKFVRDSKVFCLAPSLE